MNRQLGSRGHCYATAATGRNRDFYGQWYISQNERWVKLSRQPVVRCSTGNTTEQRLRVPVRAAIAPRRPPTVSDAARIHSGAATRSENVAVVTHQNNYL